LGIYVVILMELIMKNAIAKVIRFARDEDGITAIEYALLASLIALAIITAVQGVGTGLQNAFDKIAASV
jgi:pilus assembly protein Flp/PilA